MTNTHAPCAAVAVCCIGLRRGENSKQKRSPGETTNPMFPIEIELNWKRGRRHAAAQAKEVQPLLVINRELSVLASAAPDRGVATRVLHNCCRLGKTSAVPTLVAKTANVAVRIPGLGVLVHSVLLHHADVDVAALKCVYERDCTIELATGILISRDAGKFDALQVRVPSRSVLPQWGSIRRRPLICTCVRPMGVHRTCRRADEIPSEKYPPEKHYALFFVCV